MRYSRQRQLIYDAVRNTKRHPDAYYVYEETRKSAPNISLGTVYRNLSELSACGKIKRISAIGNVERYDGTTTPHAHFVCKKCGAIVDVDNIEVDTRLLNKDYDVESADVMLYGLCDRCK